MKAAKIDASPLLLIIITVLLAGGAAAGFMVFRSDPIEESLSGDQVINTLFVIEDQGKPLCTYVLMYYPATGRAAVFDIPGSLGLIIQRLNRVDRIDMLYDSAKIAPFQSEVGKLLGIDIGFSVAIDIDNLARITDLIEGVDIFIPVPVEVYSESPVLFPSGVTRLDGDKAKSYITYELPDETADMPVLRRQRFFLSLLKRLGEQNENLKNSQTAQVFNTYFKTGMDSRTRARLFDAFAQIDIDRVNIQSVAGVPREVSGQILLFPHWDGNLIKDIVRQTISALIRPVEGSYSDRIFTVEVLNGTPVTGMASRTADLLQGFGYDIIAIDNADRNDYQNTVIIDRSGHEESARSFGEIIRCRNIQFETPAPDDPDNSAQNHEYRADFILILGKDFNERYVTGN
ncbi:MAG: LCP family protein [Treponema sp.]|nr:LCP family protein [Treponema sp.]